MRTRLSIALSSAALVLAGLACGESGLISIDDSSDSGTGNDTTGTGIDNGSKSDTSTGGTVSGRCAAVTASVKDAGFDGKVTVHCDDTYAYLTSDTYPDHDKMNGITGTNEQVPVPAEGYVTPIRLNPVKAATPRTIDAALGVAVNGVPIYDYSSQGSLDLSAYDAKFDTLAAGQLDRCHGHAGRGDDYHYHAAPTCMIEAMANKGPAAIIGWAFDGYPIYGDMNPDGSAISKGALDLCNGQPDATFGHRYHTSTEPPYIIQCLVGEASPDADLPRVRPLSAEKGGGRPPGEPPQGGVTNLVFTESDDGSREMTYSYQGGDYFIRYQPSTKAKCFDFTEKTVTSGGVEKSGTYCR